LKTVLDAQDLLSKKSNATEAALFFQAGYPAVAFGPGKSQGNSHASNESIPLEHLERSIAFYEKLIETVCC
jgi:acetylornithine deacetylase/succinyl-diaminopimelate desuccinylase-like protein